MKTQYYIVAVRYDERHTISKVRIYQNDDIFEESKVFVLLGLASGYLIKTAFQERDGQWHEGAVVQQYKKNENLYLKTEPNELTEDNLGKLPEF